MISNGTTVTSLLKRANHYGIKTSISLCRRSYASSTTHYDTLSVSRTSTAKEIKARFYELSRKHHPDVSPDSAKKFTEINAAYSVLREEKSRRDYDRTLPHERGSSGVHQTTSGFRSSASGLSRRRTRPMGTPPSSPFRNPSPHPSSHRSPSGTAAGAASGFGFGENPASEGDVRNEHFRFDEHRERHSAFDSRYNVRVEEELSRRNAELQDNFFARFLGIAGLVFIVILLTGGISSIRAEVHDEEYHDRRQREEHEACEIDWHEAMNSRRKAYEHRFWRPK